jgi:hypothetical protein
MTAFQAITKSTTEHLGATRFNRPPPSATVSRRRLQLARKDSVPTRITHPHSRDQALQDDRFPEVIQE